MLTQLSSMFGGNAELNLFWWMAMGGISNLALAISNIMFFSADNKAREIVREDIQENDALDTSVGIAAQTMLDRLELDMMWGAIEEAANFIFLVQYA